MTKYSGQLLFLAFFIVGCNNESRTDNKHDILQAIIIDKKTDWGGNFKLHIQDKITQDSSYVYKVIALDEGLPVGFELEIPITINKFGEGVVFRSLGDTSDNFLKTLYSIYGLNPQSNLKFTKKTSCNYAGLNDLPFKGDGQKRLKRINYIKVFFEGEGENEYAELYLNIDETNRSVEFEEKDFEYRPYVAYFLTAE